MRTLRPTDTAHVISLLHVRLIPGQLPRRGHATLFQVCRRVGSRAETQAMFRDNSRAKSFGTQLAVDTLRDVEKPREISFVRRFQRPAPLDPILFRARLLIACAPHR